MANSKYEYVKNFESSDGLLPQCWIVVRIDGRAFTKFTAAHEFEKPNDERALNLMNACAKAVMEDLTDIVFAYGVSDEYSFVFRKSSTLYKRRASKLISVVVSLFAANYVLLWPKYLTTTLLQSAPAFDGRAVLYPNDQVLRDYVAWRQVDCHINNQYNTCYHALVKSGVSPEKTQEKLKGTQVEYKNELLYTIFSINYSKLPVIFRKGSCVYRKQIEEQVRRDRKTTEIIVRTRWQLVITHEDIIGDKFWKDNQHIIGGCEALAEELS